MFESMIETAPYLGMFVFMVLTGAGLPLPEELAIVIAGAMAAEGTLNPWLAVISLFFGGFLGDCVVYYLGTRLGNQVGKRGWGKKHVTPERMEKIRSLLAKHGLKVLFVVRFLVGLRLPVYLVVGASKMPFRRFLFVDMFCAAAVIGSVFSASYFLSQEFGDEVYVWVRRTEFSVTAIVVLVVAVVGFIAWRRFRKRRKSEEQEDTQKEDTLIADAAPEVAKTTEQLDALADLNNSEPAP